MEKQPDQITGLDLEGFEIFRNSLSESDQNILDSLLDSVVHFRTAVQEAGHPMTDQIVLLAMLLEERKEIERLRRHCSC